MGERVSDVTRRFASQVTTGYNDLEKDEVNIIAGALELRKKSVADVMTRIEDVYMLDYNAVLDFETVSEIMKSGNVDAIRSVPNGISSFRIIRIIDRSNWRYRADRIDAARSIIGRYEFRFCDRIFIRVTRISFAAVALSRALSRLSGFSRIPVFEGSRTNIITMLYIKDLAFVDPDDNTPLKTLCEFYQNPCNFIFEDVTLDIMFKQFKEGST